MLANKSDWWHLFYRINTPVIQHYDKEINRINYFHNGVGFGNNIAGIEGFSRLLWGVGPICDKIDKEWLDIIVLSIKKGTDPNDSTYWGDIGNHDQRMCEMPAIAMSLYWNQQFLWKQFDKHQKDNIVKWLLQIQQYECSDGNWQFFKVIVASVIKQLGYDIDEADLKEAFDKIEKCYLGNGWYRDSSRGRLDYYNPFSFHYYGIIYSLLYPDDERSHTYIQRVKRFALDYIHFYDDKGSNIPFGRSLIYRFANVGFWCALIKAEIYPIELDVMKGIIHRNINWWLTKDIFDENGMLNLGYTYPQLSLTEPYNSTVSPFWMNKIFLLLSLPDSHPYWSVEEKPLPDMEKSVIDDANMLLDHDQGHSFLLNGGQIGPNFHTLSNEKYLKFAYSSYFGFSIPRSNQLKSEQAMDSTIGVALPTCQILISEQGQTKSVIGQFIPRNQVCDLSKGANFIASTWQAMEGCCIRTWLTSIEGWQIRIHKVEISQEVVIYETGYSLKNPPEVSKHLLENGLANDYGMTAIIDLSAKWIPRQNVATDCLPNTNLMTWEMTYLPGLQVLLKPGTHILCTGVYAHPKTEYGLHKLQDIPECMIDNENHAIIELNDKQILFDLY